MLLNDFPGALGSHWEALRGLFLWVTVHHISTTNTNTQMFSKTKSVNYYARPCTHLCWTSWKPWFLVLHTTFFASYLQAYDSANRVTTRLIAAPQLIHIWRLAINSLLHDPHVQLCYQILRWAECQDADFKLWQCALQASPPGLSPMLMHRGWGSDIQMCLQLVSDSVNLICLSFIILHTILHEISYWVVHHTHGYSDESLRYGNFHGIPIGDYLSAEAHSGYLIDAKLWGGVVNWGYSYGPQERHLFRIPGKKWNNWGSYSVACVLGMPLSFSQFATTKKQP